MRILVRGGGDLSSGVVLRLYRAGWQVLVTELSAPRAVRRLVSVSQAIYDHEIQIEGMTARRVESLTQAVQVIETGKVPVMVDPEATVRKGFLPDVLLDARMRKLPPETGKEAALLVIGLGPGFTAGMDCHAVIETNRGAAMGRVIWQGGAEPDSGIPEGVAGKNAERVLRAPADGVFETSVQIGSQVKSGDLIAKVAGNSILAAFDGVLRGMIQPGSNVTRGEKVGDLDPRNDPSLCWLVSDKALAVAGGVLEAILSYPALRMVLYQSTAGNKR